MRYTRPRDLWRPVVAVNQRFIARDAMVGQRAPVTIQAPARGRVAPIAADMPDPAMPLPDQVAGGLVPTTRVVVRHRAKAKPGRARSFNGDTRHTRAGDHA